MMDFIQFCRVHGVLLDSLPRAGVWVRVKTEDKPRHRNGAVKWLGDVGFVQNWATMEEPAIWRDDSVIEGRARIATQQVRKAMDESDRLARRAAEKARRILSESELTTHPYFAAKGFPDHAVNVWEGKAVIPMRRGSEVVGCQLIDEQGAKKFLFGQRSGGAEFVFGRNGTHVLCEGYATALSAQTVLRNLKLPYVIHVTFSAGNMKRIAHALPTGVVLADNDASGTGERVAQEIGWAYWMSDVVGEDFNDAHQRVGTFQIAMGFKKVLRRR